MKKPEIYEIRINRELSKFEYYKNGKMTASSMYKIMIGIVQ